MELALEMCSLRNFMKRRRAIAFRHSINTIPNARAFSGEVLLLNSFNPPGPLSGENFAAQQSVGSRAAA